MLIAVHHSDGTVVQRIPSSWIGPRSKFRTLLSALKRDTGVTNLHTGTFHVVADVMGRGGTRRRQIRGDGRAWCPSCYFDWDDHLSSEPLIWAFDMLSACPIHGVKLEAHCYSCGAPQGFSAGFRVRRNCQECNAPLGHRYGVQESDKERIWVNRTLLQFAQWIEETDTPITSEKYLEFLSALQRRRSGEGELPPLIRAYVGTEYSVRKRKMALPTISTLLNLAAFQGVAVQDILCEPSFAASENIAPGAARFDGLLFKRRDLHLPHRRVVFVIDGLSKGAGPLPPPSLVWRQLGLWCDGVKDYCPLEHARFMERYKSQPVKVGPARYLMGTTACMRLLARSEETHEQMATMIQHLQAHFNFDEGEARQCAEAGINLHQQLELSLNEAELAAFEDKRAISAARWAADGSY